MPDGMFASSRAIMLYADTHLPEATRLYPADATAHSQVMELEERFDSVLGVEGRRWLFRRRGRRDRCAPKERPHHPAATKEASINKLWLSAPSRGAQRHPIPFQYNQYCPRNRAALGIHDPAPQACNLFSDAS